MALHLGHRYSFDLDFFTRTVFDEKTLLSELKTLPEYKEDGTGWRTVWGKVSKTKFSLFYYEHPLIKKTTMFEGIQIIHLEDIAAMKIHALEDRGTKRDFIDLYFLAKKFTFEQMFKFYNQKYQTLKDHLYIILRSLNYFADAEQDDDPKMLKKVSWEEVKKFFREETIKLAKIKLGI